MADPHRPPGRPLPDSITRFLVDPMARIGMDQAAGQAQPARIGPRRRRDAALTIGVTWAVIYNVVGAAILYWLWSGMGTPAP